MYPSGYRYRCTHRSSPCGQEPAPAAFLLSRTDLHNLSLWVSVRAHFSISMWCRRPRLHIRKYLMGRDRASTSGSFPSDQSALQCGWSDSWGTLRRGNPCCGRALAGWDSGRASYRTSCPESLCRSSSTPRNRIWCSVPLSRFPGSRREVWRCLRFLRLLHDLPELLRRKPLSPLRQSSNLPVLHQWQR